MLFAMKRVPPFSKWLYGARKNIHPSGRTNCCSILFAHPIKIQLDKYINVVKQRQHIRHYFLYLFICPLWWHFGPEAVGFWSYYNICTRKQHIQKMKMKKKVIGWTAELIWGLEAPFKWLLWCSSRKWSLLGGWCQLKKLLDLLLDASCHAGSPVFSFRKILPIIWYINYYHWRHQRIFIERIKLFNA